MSALKSMTGFAVAHGQTEAGTVEVTIRSVNSRFLEISPSLSEGVPQISYECTKLVKTVAQRGKIEYSITLIPQTQTHLSLNEPLLDELIGKLQQISAKLHANAAAATVTANFNNTATFSGTATPVSIPVEIKGNDSGCSISVSDLSQINAMELLQYPGVLQACPIDQEQLKQQILELMAQAVTKFNASRSQEGEQLRTVLIHRLDAVTAQLQRVAPLLTSLVANERERIQKRLAVLQVELTPERFETEVALQAQKADIAEEYDRLCCHVKSMRTLLQEAVSAPAPNVQTAHLKQSSEHTVFGKRLDFIIQEMMRESNTLASKASTNELSQIAVELKVLVEQMREQVQNVE